MDTRAPARIPAPAHRQTLAARTHATAMVAELHLEVMPALMQRVLEALAPLVITEGFYLRATRRSRPPPLDKRRKVVYIKPVILRRTTAMMAMRRLPTHTNAASPKPRSSFSGGGISIC